MGHYGPRKRDADKGAMAGLNIERINFLVVDDNRHMRSLVKTILHSLGSKAVTEAEDGADAFREMRTFPADIIICDWNMEPLDGLDFVRLVRTGADSPNPFVPIIMLTGHTEMNRVAEARDAGVNEFLAKPISARALYSRIREVIQHPRPFVRTRMFFGPDRRRRQDPAYKGPERRKDMQPQTGGGDDGGAEAGLSQDELDALFD